MSVDIVATNARDTDDIITIICNGSSVKFSNYDVTDNSTDVTLMLICDEEQYYKMQDILDNLDGPSCRNVVIDILDSDVREDLTALLNIQISFMEDHDLSKFMSRILEAHEFMGFITPNKVFRIVDMIHGQ